MLDNLIDTWASIYANGPLLRTAVVFLHIGGLVVGGGLAVAADRTTLLARRQDEATRAARLASLAGIHRLVVLALTAVIVSGVLMFGADVETYVASILFWLKMGLTLLLIINGGLLLRTERRVNLGDATAWPRLSFAAGASLTLWMLITLVGAALPNLG